MTDRGTSTANAEGDGLDVSTPSQELLTTLLTEAVREAVGRQDVAPRPGQHDLSLDIAKAMGSRTSVLTAQDTPAGQVAGRAPTGTGKSLAYLTPAMMMAATRGERTVISTESLSLQAQIIDKDAPVVAEAVHRVTGRRPSFAVLKGWGNYVCAQQAATTAAEIAGQGQSTPGPSVLPALLTHIQGKLGRAQSSSMEPTVILDDVEYPASELLPLVEWALDASVVPQPGDDPKPADRHSYPGNTDQKLWETVSTTPDACPGASKCAFGSVCAPTKARAQAAGSDLVVTNHSMLAVQAATGAPVILGNRRLGVFDHAVIDEAHTLASQVRNQGAKAIDAWRIYRTIKTFEKHVIPDANTGKLVDQGYVLAEDVDRALASKVAAARHKTKFGAAVVEIGPEEDPLEDRSLGDRIGDWVSALTRAMPQEDSVVHDSERMKIMRSRKAIAALAADAQFIRDAGTDRARWYEDGRGDGRYVGAALKASPVDVSTLLRGRVWTADVISTMEPGDVTNPRAADRPLETWAVPEYRWVEPPEDKNPPRYALSVSCVSATLNSAFTVDMGLSVKRSEYESPFADSYAASALFVPRATTREDLVALTRDPDAHRLSFDTKKHPTWATKMIVDLVKANGGRALVLAATSEAGKGYADSLRIAMAVAGLSEDIHIYSQWDGPPPRMLLGQWKDDHSSVMVGTRSLMTGVDAPGQTCSLVIVDRVPRSAGNPVDDARVASTMENTGMDKWAADRFVYVADCALLLDQAAGRLVRSVSDSGMVAVLDPRLLKSGRLSYQEQARKTLMEPLEKFATKMADLPVAVQWLTEHRKKVDGG